MERSGTTSIVNLKAICPKANNQPFSQLEFNKKDPLHNNKPSITWWEGLHDEHCESRWELVINQSRYRSFEIPGVPFKFIIVSGQIYYRKNVEY